jgi:hypothetical protein
MLPNLDANADPSDSTDDASSDSNAAADALNQSAAAAGTTPVATTAPVLFAGKQHIVSDAPDPDNTIQTILQPDVLNPPRLRAPLPIPSIVKIAAAHAPPSLSAPQLSVIVHAPPAPDPAPVPPHIPAPQPTDMQTVALTPTAALVDSPKLPVMVTAGRSYAPPAPPPQPAASPKAVAGPPAAPSTAPPNAAIAADNAKPANGQDQHNLLVVNAVEVHGEMPSDLIPAGELHAHFEVAANVIPHGPSGTGSAPSHAGASGSGNGTAINSSSSGSGTSGSAHAAGTGNRELGANGHGSRPSSASGNGTGAGSAHTSGGHGTGTHGEGAASTGNGNGNSSGNGTGISTGAHPSPFPGMTIVGGEPGRSSPSPSAPSPGNVAAILPKHEGYGMTIIASGGSGGAVRDFGVFNDGPAFTVYLDVSKLGIAGTRWSLEYGASRDVRFSHPGMLLTPPYPTTQILPHLPAATVSANIGRVIVIEATLTAKGSLDSARVLQSPDSRINPAILDCLSHWTFDASTMGADKVAVKVLLGIPLDSAMSSSRAETVSQAN